jgi:hypothetical protein
MRRDQLLRQLSRHTAIYRGNAMGIAIKASDETDIEEADADYIVFVYTEILRLTAEIDKLTNLYHD